LAVLSAQQYEHDLQNMPSLPKPIAKEMVLITSAGQSTDTYIVKDIANKLMIHNYFMPQSDTLEYDEINSVVFVIGYSEISEMLFDTNYDHELSRIKKLVSDSEKMNLKVISIFIGGQHRKDDQTKALLEYLGTNSDYIIATADGDRDQSLYQIAKTYKIPITIVNKLEDISEPFASAFR
jgi:hypothetical protein